METSLKIMGILALLPYVLGTLLLAYVVVVLFFATRKK